MKQTAYLLDPDPDTTIFRAFELPDGISFKPIHDLIGCRLIELVRFDERHSLFVDEEGLRDGLTAFTIFEGYPQPLAGKIVCESACRRSRVSFGSRLTRDLDVPVGRWRRHGARNRPCVSRVRDQWAGVAVAPVDVAGAGSASRSRGVGRSGRTAFNPEA